MSKAVFLIGFGGPTKPEEVRPFLDRVLSGRLAPPERYEEVARQYEAVGGASPYNAQVAALAESLRRSLAETRDGLPVYLGMRNASPFIGDALRRMKDDGVSEAAGVVLSSFRSEPSWDRYVSAVEEARAALGDGAPAVRYITPWCDDALFHEAVADRVREILALLDDARRKDVRAVFTVHSIPLSLDRTSGYSQQARRAAEAVAKVLDLGSWSLAYQSRSGRPEDPWLEPDVGEALLAFRSAGRERRDALVVPLGFLTDHVEVLYDLDVKARRVADWAGMTFLRAPTVGSHPSFLRLLSHRVGHALSAAPAGEA